MYSHATASDSPKVWLRTARAPLGCLALVSGALAVLAASGVTAVAPARLASGGADTVRQPSGALPTQMVPLAFVTDNRCVPLSGCDAVSVVDVEQAAVVHHGQHFGCSPGRLAGSADGSTVVSLQSNMFTDKLPLTLVQRVTGLPPWSWHEQVVLPHMEPGEGVALMGGIAMTPDGQTILTAVSDIMRQPSQTSYGLAK